MNLGINEEVFVILKENGYFNPQDGRREVSISDKDDMETHLLGLDNPDQWSKEYKVEVFKKKGIMEIKSVPGIYVGSRPGLVKIKPFYGLQNPEPSIDSYFIISEGEIAEISKLNREKVGC